MRIKKMTLSAVFLALALIIGMVEYALPPVLPPLPYAKLGLSNIVILAAIYVLGARYSCLIVLLKCFFISIFIGNFSAMLYSVPAGLASFLLMWGLVASGLFSTAAVSVAGAMVHNIVQVLSASLIVGNFSLFVLLPYLMLFGSAAGLLTGILCHFILKRLPARIFPP